MSERLRAAPALPRAARRRRAAGLAGRARGARRRGGRRRRLPAQPAAAGRPGRGRARVRRRQRALPPVARGPARRRAGRASAAGGCSTSTPIRAPSPSTSAPIRCSVRWSGGAGLRVPGAVDGAELAVRAVLGQQVSVPAARTGAGRLVAEHGEALARPRGAVTALFPAPAALAALDPARLAMPRARARALVGLCRALADGELRLDPGADRAEARRRLLALPGIGPWTAGYVAMRALGDPDVFLVEDLGVRHALRRLGGPDDPRAARALAAAWAPWRSYATQHLWHAPAGGGARRVAAGWHHPGRDRVRPRAPALRGLPARGRGPAGGRAPGRRRARPRRAGHRRAARRGSGALRAAVAQRVHGGGARDVGARARGAARARRRARRRAGHGGPRRRRAAAAGRRARLRRLLLVARSRDERRAAVPSRRRGAAAQLAPPAGRLSRARRHRGGQRHADPPPARAAPASRATTRPSSAPACAWTSSSSWASWSACRARSASRWRRSRARPRLRRAAGQRLERARPAGVGVPPARARSWPSRSRPRWPRGSRRWRRSSIAASPRPPQEPAPLPYLREEPWALDLDLEVELNGTVVARTNARHLYWSAAQQLAHMTVNGASLSVGDLFASGTISGPEREQRGLAARAVVERRRADRARRRVDAQLPGGRRRGRPARRAAATRWPSARSAGGSSRRPDGAAQGHPAPGARPRCATTCGCARSSSAPGSSRRARCTPRTTRPSCARRRPGAGASSSSASTRGRRPSCCARSSTPAPSCTSSTPSATTAGRCRRGGGRPRAPAAASWPAPRAATRARA